MSQNATNDFASWISRFIVGRKPKWTLVRVLFVIVVSFVLFTRVLIPIRVTGISMEPAYRDGRINMVNKLAYRSSTPQRGDVIGIRTEAFKAIYMKRVIGLPNETISMRGGVTYVNGQPIEEPYTKANPDWNRKPIHLEENQYFVVGDNRSMALRDHAHGAVHFTNIVGRVLF